MSSGYFHLLNKQTNTRFWINNPTAEELTLAMDAGAVSCTTNPAYCARLLEQEPEYMRSVIDEAILEANPQQLDESVLAQIVCGKVTARLVETLESRFAQSGGREGFVTLQEDPRRDQDAGFTIAQAIQRKSLGKNFMAKIPVIEGGIEAIEACVRENIPICATEVFSISQAMDICEIYEAASAKYGNAPAFYVTHITGIFDEYLGKVAKRDGVEVSPAAMREAGLTIARKEYRMIKERGYRAIMLGGGARGTHHFTGLTGGSANITINWSTAQEILDLAPQIENSITMVENFAIVEELTHAFPDFAKAYEDHGLTLAEYAEFGPVQLFRNAFLKGWYMLLSEICARKNALAR
jgi:transaldolase